MDDLRRIARAHYEAASREMRAMAEDFFGQLDNNGDRFVSRQEFSSFMTRKYDDRRMSSSYFFRLLKSNPNGECLDFWDVITLYYIVKSRPRFCERCNMFITGAYFSCVECFHRSRGPFNLCIDCYRRGEYDHNHNDRTVQFLDNHTLLELKRTASRMAPSQGMGSPSSSTQQGALVLGRSQSTLSTSRRQGGSNQSNAIVLAQRRPNEWRDHALRALEQGVLIATTLCSIL